MSEIVVAEMDRSFDAGAENEGFKTREHQSSWVAGDGDTWLLMHLEKQSQKGQLQSDASSNIPSLVNLYTLFLT